MGGGREGGGGVVGGGGEVWGEERGGGEVGGRKGGERGRWGNIRMNHGESDRRILETLPWRRRVSLRYSIDVLGPTPGAGGAAAAFLPSAIFSPAGDGTDGDGSCSLPADGTDGNEDPPFLPLPKDGMLAIFAEEELEIEEGNSPGPATTAGVTPANCVRNSPDSAGLLTARCCWSAPALRRELARGCWSAPALRRGLARGCWSAPALRLELARGCWSAPALRLELARCCWSALRLELTGCFCLFGSPTDTSFLLLVGLSAALFLGPLAATSLPERTEFVFPPKRTGGRTTIASAFWTMRSREEVVLAAGGGPTSTVTLTP